MIWLSPFRLVFLQIPFISSLSIGSNCLVCSPLNFPPGVSGVKPPSISKVQGARNHRHVDVAPRYTPDQALGKQREGILGIGPNPRNLKRTASWHLPGSSRVPKKESRRNKSSFLCHPGLQVRLSRLVSGIRIHIFQGSQTCERPIYPRPGAEPSFYLTLWFY